MIDGNRVIEFVKVDADFGWPPLSWIGILQTAPATAIPSKIFPFSSANCRVDAREAGKGQIGGVLPACGELRHIV
jgi:hypothetical protein